MRVFNYKVVLQHDNGSMGFITAATSKAVAIAIVLKAENAPLSAVTSAKQLKAIN